MGVHSQEIRPQRKGKRVRQAALLAVAALVATAELERGARAQDWTGDRDGSRASEHSWPSWGGNLDNTHGNAAEETINADNANLLQQKWVFTTAGDVSATPTVSQGSVYVPDWGGFIYRIDARTGKAIWSHKVSEYTGNAGSFSRNSPAIGGREIVFGDQASGSILAVDKATGKLLWSTSLASDVGTQITASAVIAGDRVYVGAASNQETLALQPGSSLSFRGSIAALDLRTGRILWQTYTVPAGYTGGGVWSSNFVIDARRNSLFATTGNNYSVPDSVTACLTVAGTDVTAQLACLDPADYIDGVLALDLQTGKVKWVRRLEGADTALTSCQITGTGGIPCPDPHGPDYDFGDGAHLIRTEVDGKRVEEIGAGQKSGVYWALNPDTGAVLWGTQVGPGASAAGGIQWGTATDGKRVYAAVNNFNYQSFPLQPEKTQEWNAGSWAALDSATGAVLWQVPATGQNPLKPTLPAGAEGQVTVANGVFYAGSMSGDMVALDAATGKLLWKFASGGSVIDGPSVVDGTVYWGSGYRRQAIGGSGNNQLFAFSLPGGERGSR